MLLDAGEPSCYHKAIFVHDHARWKKDMQNELDSIHKNGTQDLVPLPKGRKTLPCISTNTHLIVLFLNLKLTL